MINGIKCFEFTRKPTLRSGIVPAHCRMHYTNQKLDEQLTGSSQGAGILGRNRHDASRGSGQPDCCVDSNVEQRMIIGTRPLDSQETSRRENWMDIARIQM